MTQEQEHAIHMLVYTRWIVFADGVETKGDEIAEFDCYDELRDLKSDEYAAAYDAELKTYAFAEPSDQALWLDFVRWDELRGYGFRTRTPEQETEYQQLEISKVKRGGRVEYCPVCAVECGDDFCSLTCEDQACYGIHESADGNFEIRPNFGPVEYGFSTRGEARRYVEVLRKLDRE